MALADNITGIILAGGAGRRVENQDKGLIMWRGKPLVAHVHDRLRPQVSDLILSCNRNLPRYRELAALVVCDTRQDFQGPLAGLEVALPHIKTEFLVVVACDTPNLPDNLVTRLIAPLLGTRGGRPEISYAHDGLREQYLCAAMCRDSLLSLSGFLDEGHRAVRDFYGRRDTVAVDFSDCPESFANYNTLAALA